MSRLVDITGQRFGRLVVLEREGLRDGQSYWKCQCDCGNIKVIRGSQIRKGKTVSCGCYGKEQSKLGNPIHGLRHTRLNRIWNSMKQRCYNSKSPNFENYGGRGISICDEWRKDFLSFYNWSLSNGYSKDLSIDRIDVNGNYEPSNCRWTTQKVQANNTRVNVYIEYNGETHTMKQWAELLDIPYYKLKSRHSRGYEGIDIIRPYILGINAS